MSESDPPSTTLSLRIKTLAAELPCIDIPASATVLELKRRIEEHICIEIEQPISKRVRLMQQKNSDTCDELSDNSQTLASCNVTDGAELSVIIETLLPFNKIIISFLAFIDQGKWTEFLAMYAGALDLTNFNFKANEATTGSIDKIVNKLSAALMTNRTITSLNLQQVRFQHHEKPLGDKIHGWGGHAYIIHNSSVTQLAEALKHNTTITELNLKNHMLRESGVNAIIEMLQENKTIRSLLLSNNFMYSMQTTELLVNAIKHRSEFTALGIVGFPTDDTVISELLAPDSKLTQLEVDVRDDKHICNLLTTNATVTDLELGLLGGYESGSGLAQMISLNSTITSLNLSKNKLFDIGTTELTDALKRNHSITSLILQHDKIQSTAAGNAIAILLTDNSRIVKLDLFANRMGSDGVISIIRAIASNAASVMQDLELGQTEMTGECAAEIVKLVDTNSTITKLGVSENSLGGNGMRSICEALKRNRSLKLIDIRKTDCIFTSQAARNIRAARGDEVIIWLE